MPTLSTRWFSVCISLALLVLDVVHGFSVVPNVRTHLPTRMVPVQSISQQRSFSPSSSLLGLRMTKEKTEVTSSSTSSKQQTSLFEPGGGPTIVIEDDESPKEIYQQAIQRTLFWVVAAAVFGGAIFVLAGPETAEEFYAGYLVEQSLSVDNLFVFLLLFDFFRVPLSCQDRVLNWGIYGAIVMRAIMIGIGAAALHEFHAILLVFAGILVYSSLNVLLGGEDEEEEDMSENSIVQFSNRLIDSTDEFDGDRFFTMVEGVKKATPLFICMIAVEISDVVFAVDSIPAVFGVTDNPLVVFSSNMFAIMGLRSLYTILSKAAQDLKYLEPAVAYVLGFIGAKMIGEYFGYNTPTEIALAVVATLLGGGVGLSLLERQQTAEET